MAINIGPKISLDGEAEFKTAIKNATAAVKALDAELEASQQTFANNADSIEELSKQNELLKNKADILKQKMSVLQEEYERVAEAQGKNSAAALKLRTDIAKTETEIIKNNRALEENNDLLDDNEEKLKKAGKASEDFSQDSSSAFDGVTDAAKATSTAIIALSAALVALTIDSANTVAELNSMSAQLGVSTQTIQELQYASKFVGVEFDTMSDSINETRKKLGEAKAGSEEALSMFRELDVSIYSGVGTLRSAEEVWREVLVKLGNVSDETERTSIAMALMGEEAYKLNGIMGISGVLALDAYATEAQKAGYVMSEQTKNSLQELNDEYDRAMLQLEATKTEIAAELAPSLIILANKFNDVLKAATPFIKDALEWIITHGGEIAQVIAWITGGLIGLKIVSTLTSLMSAFNTTMAVTNATMLANPAAWIAAGIVAAVALLAAALYEWAKSSSQMVDSVGDVGEEIEAGLKGAQESVESFNEGMTEVIESLDWKGLESKLTSIFSDVGKSSADAFNEGLKNNIDIDSAFSSINKVDIGFSNGNVSNTVLVSELINAMKSAFPQNSAIQPVSSNKTIQMIVNGRTVAEVIWDPLNDVARQKGVDIINAET